MLITIQNGAHIETRAATRQEIRNLADLGHEEALAAWRELVSVEEIAGATVEAPVESVVPPRRRRRA